MLPEITSDWIFFGASAIFVGYLLLIFLTKSQKLRKMENHSGDSPHADL